MPAAASSELHVVDPRGCFDRFARLAARLITSGVRPSAVRWMDSVTGDLSLFAPAVDDEAGTQEPDRPAVRVGNLLGPRGWLAACHASEDRWPLMYSLVHRAVAEREPAIMHNPVDAEVRQLELWARAVRRDAHKAKAFVRFRRVAVEAGDRYVAWHRPDHWILKLVAPHFAARFNAVRWTIFTPRESVDWDCERLTFGAGVPASEAQAHDELEEMWRTYYRSIFNPARIRLGAMVKEMPARHWRTLPETRVIDEMLSAAPSRVRSMIELGSREPGAEAFMPAGVLSLPVLQKANRGCAGCGLAELATQAVWGEGPLNAPVMLVGEQPGDEEDIAGRPFVGPAGRLMDAALQDAGLRRSDMYITNAVKHFKFVPRGKKRIHQRAGASEVRACRPWLVREIELVNPRLVVLLGATAGQSLLGPGYRVSVHRGGIVEQSVVGATLFATIHPSLVLRTPPAGQASAYEAFVTDLKRARALLHGFATAGSASIAARSSCGA